MNLKLSKLRTSSLLKVIFISQLSFWLTVCIIAGIFCLTGNVSFTLGTQKVTGFLGLLISPMMGLLFSLIFSVLISLPTLIGVKLIQIVKDPEIEFNC